MLIKKLVLLKGLRGRQLLHEFSTEVLDDLKQRLISARAEFKLNVIGKTIDQWQPRLGACVRALCTID